MQNKKKILIVDDEKNLIALVALHMQMAGYEPLFATDGEEALSMVEQEKPDLVILDLMLPKLDGWEVCQRIRAKAEIKAIPIIMLTARVEIEDKLKGFAMIMSRSHLAQKNWWLGLTGY
ncbi:MAG: response regulator [Candidatus Omnitrophota bacterium]|jgi:two-component system alkaline phosphatase synthesis response regulator PhoP